MPHPSPKLDLICCCVDMEQAVDKDQFNALIERWQTCGWIDDTTRATGDHLIEQGFARVWLDTQDKITIYANNQGGYKVNCPECNAPIARPFARAVRAWRQGGPRELSCWACRNTCPLEAHVFSPPVAFATGAIVFSDIQVLYLSQDAVDGVRSVLGDEFRIVLRRLA